MKRRSIIRSLMRFAFITLPALLIVLAFMASAAAWVLSYRVTASWHRKQPDGAQIYLGLTANRNSTILPTWPPPLYVHLEAHKGTAVFIFFGEWHYLSQLGVPGWLNPPTYDFDWSHRSNWGVLDLELKGGLFRIFAGRVQLWFSTTALGGLTAMVLIFWYRGRRRFRRRTDLCMACGYDLTGNASGACPECGKTTA